MNNTDIKINLEKQILILIPKNLAMITHLHKLYEIVLSIPFHNADEYQIGVNLCDEFNTLIGLLSSGLNKIIGKMNHYIDSKSNKSDLKKLRKLIYNNESLVSIHFDLPVCIEMISYDEDDKNITDDQYQFLVKFVCKTLNHEFEITV